MSARRVQQRRAKGWRKPPGARSVVRGTRWGNPYRVADHGRDGCPFGVGEVGLVSADGFVRLDLAGADLMCWCPLDQACHADVLLRIANGGAA